MSVSQMDLFKYDENELKGATFRLIRLQGGEGDPIKCELFEAQLHQHESGIDWSRPLGFIIVVIRSVLFCSTSASFTLQLELMREDHFTVIQTKFSAKVLLKMTDKGKNNQ